MAAIYNIEPSRVQSIDSRLELPYGEPAVLAGCHTQSLNSENFVFTRNGSFPFALDTNGVANGVLIIKGYFARLEKGKCYEMAVKYQGTGRYRYGPQGFGPAVTIRTYRLLHHTDGARLITSVQQWERDNSLEQR